MKQRAHYFYLALLLGSFTVLSVLTAKDLSMTLDEVTYLRAGTAYVRSLSLRTNQGHPPLLPVLFSLPGKFFCPTNDCELLDDIHFTFRLLIAARLLNIAIALCGALIVYCWGTRELSPPWALFSTFLYCTNPEILAHSSLATLDIGVTVLFLLSLFLFSEFLKVPTPLKFAAAALCSGLAVAAKFSAFFLFPIMLLTYFLNAPKGQRGAAILRALAFTVLSFVALASVYSAFAWNDRRGFLFALVAEPWRAITDIIERNRVGHLQYFLGTVSTHSWPQYFLCAFALKETAVLIVLTLIAIPIACRQWRNLFSRLLLLSIGTFFTGMSLLSNVDIGFRYMLPLQPLLALLIAFAIRSLASSRRIIVTLATAYQLFTLATTHPFYLSYFNEFAGGRAHGADYLLDSNLDWGQNTLYLKQYLEENHIEEITVFRRETFLPLWQLRLYGIPRAVIDTPPTKPIVFVTSVATLRGLPLIPFTFELDELLRHTKPRAIINDVTYVYDLKPQEP